MSKWGGLLCLGVIGGFALWGTLGCAVAPGPVYTKDGKFYGVVPGVWRERWWNYYQRGLSYAEGEYL